MSDIVEIALDKGDDGKLDKHTSANLGFSEEKTPVKRVWYDSDKSPDHLEHVFNVVYKETDTKALKPIAVVWGITQSTITAEGKFIDGRGFRLSLDGKLQNAMKVTGKVGKLQQSRLPVSASEVKEAFKRELKFWLTDSVAIAWQGK